MTQPLYEFTRRITEFPEGEKSFIEIPFTVDDSIERIEVSYVFPAGSGGSVIDIGLAQNGRMRGWSGSERGHVHVAADRATPGYDLGALPGRWDVVLGIVKIGPNCYTDLRVRLVPKRRTWLVGDIHSHSEHSDGGVTVLDAIHRARASRLDFVAITDHNTVSQNIIRPDDPDILVIPAMELTSFYGHTNFFGLERPVEDWRCRSPQDVADKMAEARSKGATVVINHPFQNSDGGRWQAGFDVAFDAMEIWNGNWTPMNQQAIDFWQELLCAGRRIPVTAGSDFHLKNRRRHGHPSNRLLAESHTVAGILEAIRAGRNVVAAGPDDRMAKPADEAGPQFGEEARAGQKLATSFTGLAAGDELRVITDKGVVEALSPDGATLTHETAFASRFLRYEIWNGGEPRLFTNPYYAG